jgi:hypothetical protein
MVSYSNIWPHGCYTCLLIIIYISSLLTKFLNTPLCCHKWPLPATKKQLQCFLRSLNFYHRRRCTIWSPK